MTSQQTPPANDSALEMLPLPKVTGLSGAQRRGATCAWCDSPLTAETAHNLGERPAPDGGTMFPRGCMPCVRSTATRAYNVHSRTCEQCTDDPTLCDDRRALRRLALEGRR